MLGLASFITLSILLGFVATVIFMVMYVGGQIDATFLIGGTIIVNAILWLISPFFMDLMYRWIYKSKKITIDYLRQRSARLAGFIEKVCQKYNFKIPKLIFIQDDNPTAFVFGSGAFNARLAFSEGLFTYLAEDEIEAVIAHELGHIRRRDFIIMTVASTLLQILYELSQILMRMKSRGGGKNKGNPLPLIGLIAYVFYLIGIYLLLFLSRTREYGADAFSAEETGNPDGLSRALIKIAYGIVAKPDDKSQQKLMNSSRALGIFDPKAAQQIGTAFGSSKQDWNYIGKVLLFDLVSPWAKIMELASTHPLTGKRIEVLSKLAANKGQKPSIDMAMVRQQPVDKEQLYRGFAAGVFVYFLPHLAIIGSLALGIYDNYYLAALPGALGVALLLQILYKYPHGQARQTNTLEVMSNLYASPVRGQLVALEGQAIGRGQAGSILSEDMMFQDQTGLIYLNYESAFSFLGNFFFGLSKVKKLLNKPAKINGWFFRGVSHHLDLKTFDCEGQTIKSHPMLWGVIIAVILIIVSYNNWGGW